MNKGVTVGTAQGQSNLRNGLDLSGKHALITGGGAGLGRQMAEALAEAGARVTICGRTEEPLARTTASLTGAGCEARYVVCDVTRADDRRGLREQVTDVDILVNNAARGERQPWLTVTVEQWRSIFELNLEAPFALAQLFVPQMTERGWGRVINVSSIYGVAAGDPAVYGEWGVDLASYVASKHGLIGLTKHLAATLGNTGVTVNALCPGMFPNTDANSSHSASLVPALSARTPVKRCGNDDDLRAAIVYLASPGSSFYTGQSLIVDGGWLVW